MATTNEQFEIGGVNHLALVCSDMERTVDFYTKVLGLPLIKTIELPMGMGQHFFFDIGNGDCLAFFWFPNSPAKAPGISSPSTLPGAGDLATAIGSMNHVALSVPAERIEEYREKLIGLGIECTDIYNHDDSEYQVSPTMHDGVFVRSVYFFDPDGILLEFAAWTRTFTEADIQVAPARALVRR